MNHTCHAATRARVVSCFRHGSTIAMFAAARDVPRRAFERCDSFGGSSTVVAFCTTRATRRRAREAAALPSKRLRAHCARDAIIAPRSWATQLPRRNKIAFWKQSGGLERRGGGAAEGEGGVGCGRDPWREKSPTWMRGRRREWTTNDDRRRRRRQAGERGTTTQPKQLPPFERGQQLDAQLGGRDERERESARKRASKQTDDERMQWLGRSDIDAL